MAQFDDLVAKYRNLSYGRLAGTNPSAVNSLLNAQDRGTNSITSPNYFGNIPIEQQQYIETPTGFIGQNQFRIDPNTGIPVFETPTTEAINQGIEMGGGIIGSGVYDQDVDYGDPGYAGVIPADPDTGLVGTTTEQQQQRGGEGRDKTGPGVSTEVIGGRVFRFDEEGNVTRLDPESIDARFATFMDKILGYTPVSLARGLLDLDDNPNEVYSRILDKYGEETATAFSIENAKAINKEMNTNAAARRAEVEANFRETATQAEKDRLDMTDKERGIVDKESTGISRTPGDSGTAADAAGFSGGANPSGEGQYGGR